MKKKTDKVEVKDANKRVKELQGQLARALADYDNLSRRVEKEKEELEVVASLGLVINLLPIFDMFDQAQIHLKDPGLAITIKEFEDVLRVEGVEKISVNVGDKFDTEVHEAIVAQDVKINSGKKLKGEVSEVLLAGWRVKNGPVIRYTKVKVR